ncbi:hypothetical protein C0991_003082 [Blastosporella zonata]|nr:hypothetical protein C0991_003082 [Blastosporella zonata]
MIVVPSDEDDKHRANAAAVAPEPSHDPPPTYTVAVPPVQALAEPIPSQSSSATAVQPTQPAMKPTNFISISRGNASVKGTWLLDPFLTIPSMLLPPLSPDETPETRRNLALHTSNGPINADITFASHDTNVELDKKSRKRSTLYAKASNGAVTLKIHAPHSTRLPFYMKVEASNGPVYIYIPRSFNGLVSVTRWNGNSKFSTQVSTNLTTFSDVNKTYKCFIGDHSAIAEGGEWEGDEVVVDARNGSVKVHYDDELSYDNGDKKSGFFGRLFGF